jgi:hypothetical protein
MGQPIGNSPSWIRALSVVERAAVPSRPWPVELIGCGGWFGVRVAR